MEVHQPNDEIVAFEANISDNISLAISPNNKENVPPTNKLVQSNELCQAPVLFPGATWVLSGCAVSVLGSETTRPSKSGMVPLIQLPIMK